MHYIYFTIFPIFFCKSAIPNCDSNFFSWSNSTFFNTDTRLFPVCLWKKSNYIVHTTVGQNQKKSVIYGQAAMFSSKATINGFLKYFRIEQPHETFKVIVQLLVNTLFIALFFHFQAKCRLGATTTDGFGYGTYVRWMDLI